MLSFISTPILPSLRPRPCTSPNSLSIPGGLTLISAAKKSNGSSKSSSHTTNINTKRRSRGGNGKQITGGNHSILRKSKSRRSRNLNTMNNDKWNRVQPTDTSTRNLSNEKELRKSNDLRPENCPALVLNADFSPLSYMPLSLWPWQDVVKAVFLDRVTVVATYDIGVRSPGMIFPLPSVISLKEYQPMAVKRPAFTRFNVFMRDNFSCQYCGKRYPTQELTFDHVIPRCNNGKTNWTNVVTACIGCNHKKGRKMLSELRDMKLMKKPKEPSNMELQKSAKKFPPRYLHESWRDYVYWSQSMEEEEEVEL